MNHILIEKAKLEFFAIGTLSADTYIVLNNAGMCAESLLQHLLENH